MAKLLTLAALLAQPAFKSEEVEVPELGGAVLVRDIAAGDRDRLVAFFAQPDAGQRMWEYKRLVLALALCNEEGERLIPDDQVDALKRLGGTVIDRLFLVALRISGMAAESAEEARKNSSSSRSSDSGTDSPDTTAAPSPS